MPVGAKRGASAAASSAADAAAAAAGSHAAQPGRVPCGDATQPIGNPSLRCRLTAAGAVIFHTHVWCRCMLVMSASISALFTILCGSTPCSRLFCTSTTFSRGAMDRDTTARRASLCLPCRRRSGEHGSHESRPAAAPLLTRRRGQQSAAHHCILCACPLASCR